MLDAGAVEFPRKFEFIGNDRLVLTPVGGANPPAHLTWERIRE
jgi:hypothetical protein